MKFYKLLNVETGEYVHINPKYIVFYKRTAKGVLIDMGSIRIIVVQSDFEDMLAYDGVEEW